jgi:hypothetical protein
MKDAYQSEANKPTSIDWRMSASLENVIRDGEEYAEVTSLEQAVHAWSALDEGHQAHARLMMDRPVTIDGVVVAAFTGVAIATLFRHLPSAHAGGDVGDDTAGLHSSAGADQGMP